jgi:hypothetical protein
MEWGVHSAVRLLPAPLQLDLMPLCLLPSPPQIRVPLSKEERKRLRAARRAGLRRACRAF